MFEQRIEQRIAQMNADVLDVKNVLTSLKENVKKIEEQSSFTESLATKEEFAKLCRVSYATISRRLNEGFYETPKGYTRRAYYNQGNQGNAIFNVPVALEYAEINNPTINAPRQPTD